MNSKSVEASVDIHDELTASIKKTGDQLDDLMQNEKLSAETKDELKAASDAAAEALKELAQAQLDADAAMQNYQQVMASGTEDLDKLEAAAEQAGHAAESLAAANGKASDATDALAKSTQKASDEADKASKTGAEAVETIAQALAAAGITATIKEITSAVYDLTDTYSNAEKSSSTPPVRPGTRWTVWAQVCSKPTPAMTMHSTPWPERLAKSIPDWATLATRCPKSPGNFWTLPTSPGRMSSALCSSSQR